MLAWIYVHGVGRGQGVRQQQHPMTGSVIAQFGHIMLAFVSGTDDRAALKL